MWCMNTLRKKRSVCSKKFMLRSEGTMYQVCKPLHLAIQNPVALCTTRPNIYKNPRSAHTAVSICSLWDAEQAAIFSYTALPG